MDDLNMRLSDLDQDEDDLDKYQSSSQDPSKQNEKFMILGSLVPNLVMNNLEKKSYTFRSVLLMADVSGFTELCDKYSKNSIRASSQITEIINIYMGEMVKVIYEFNGDVVNYSGDAILALWLTDNHEEHSQAILAADCAIYIQERIGEYVTQVNTLRVKVTITTGMVNYLVVGDDNKKDFIILGDGIMDLKKTEKYSSAGKIVVTSSLINAVTKKRFKFESAVPNEIWRLVGHKFGVDFVNNTKFKQEGGTNYLMNLRPILRNICVSDAEIIKLFMMSAVNKYIDMTGRVENMTEMRNVVIVFVNIITSPDIEFHHLAEIIEECYVKISKVVIKMEGAVNKFSLFDKDLMFLVVFGLRYYKGSVTEKTALKCSKEMKGELDDVKDVKSVSIGVTSGTVYCGVVGHPVRREFTVIGLKVNMAARLMVAYPKQIVCDRETFLHSRIDYKNFILQEPKYLKGISNVGPIYMYVGQEKDDDHSLRISTNFPLLGRDTEMAAFDSVMKKAFSERKADTKNVIAFLGESGIGKTRILEEVRIICQDKFLCLLVELQSNCLDTPYSGIQEICRGPLGLTENSTIYERESRLYNLLKGEDYNKSFICLLNRVFNVKFEYTSEYYRSNGSTRVTQLRKLMILIMKRLTLKPTVLIVDNTEYMDKISWLLLYDISKLPRILTVLGIGTKAELNQFAKKFLKRKIVKTVTLGRIDQDYIIGLACQILSVDAIPYELLVEIQKGSDGNPGWVEGFLLVCIQTGYLYFRDDKPDHLFMERLVRAPKYMTERGHNISTSKLMGRSTGSYFNQTENDIVKTCVIADDFKNEDFPINRESRCITSFYGLPQSAKTILKCCAVLGDLFSREMLKNLLESVDESELSDVIQLLFEKKILGCATKTHSYDLVFKFVMRKRLLNLTSDNKIECLCQLNENEFANLSKPKYAYCQFLRFVSHDFNNAVNLLLTHGEKKEYHTKSIFYLQQLDIQCSACKRHEGRWKHIGIDNVVFSNITLQDIDTPGKILLGHLESSNNPENEHLFSRLLGKPCMTRTLRFSYVHLSDCQCHVIRLKLNEQFIYHCFEGEILEAAINCCLDNTILYLTFADIIQASNLIEKAGDLLSRISKFINEPYTWKISCTNGLLNTLRGLCKFYVGHISESVNLIRDSLVDYGCVFPHSDSKIWVKTKAEIIKMKYLITHGQSKIGKNKILTNQEFVTEVLITESLNFLARSYTQLCNWKFAKLAAIWALNKTLKSGNNFFLITFALGNVLYLAPKIDSGNFFNNLREFAEKLSCMYADEASYIELRGILHLYLGLFSYSMCTGELEDAIEYSHIALSISIPVQEFENRLRYIPKIIILYLLQLDIHSAISKLVEYESVMNSDVDSSSRTWYLALVMFIALYCGIELMPYDEATSFLDKSGKLTVVKDLESEITLTCCMWLYTLRKKMWTEASTWLPKYLVEDEIKMANSNMVNLIIFEGMLLQFSRIESINMHSNLDKKIIYIDKHLADVIDEDLMWKPKYLHLVAYRQRLESQKSLSKQYLIQAENMADFQGNKLESFSISSDRERWTSDYYTGHNVLSIKPIEWKGNLFKRVVVYNLPIDDHFF